MNHAGAGDRFRPSNLGALLLCLTLTPFVSLVATASDIAYQQVSSLGIVSEGRYLSSRLVAGPDAIFYGTTYGGGAATFGRVFSITQDGSNVIVLHSFQRNSGDGAYPYADMIIAPDGMLYGTTQVGGSQGLGTIFRMRLDGSDYRVVFNFGPAASTGQGPRGHMEMGTNGFF